MRVNAKYSSIIVNYYKTTSHGRTGRANKQNNKMKKRKMQ